MFKNLSLREALEDHVIISITNISGKITYASRAFQEISGYSQQELIGKDHSLLNSGQHGKDFFSNMWERLKSGKVWRGRICNIAKNGNLYWVETTISPLFSKTGVPEGFVSIRYDVSEQVRAEKAMGLEFESTESSSRFSTLAEVAAGLAHEICNPLAVIEGNAHLLEEQLGNLPSPARALTAVKKINRMVFRITSIVRGLRKFSGKAHQHTQKYFYAANLFKELEVICGPSIQAREIAIEFVLSNTDIEVFGDEVELSQVLINLINNAADAIQNQQKKWIKVECCVEERTLKIAVTDSGLGIPLSVQKKMMQPFFTTKEIGKGTGMGLSISKGIIVSMGGTLKYCADSKNTRFEISLQLPAKTGLKAS